MARRIKLKVAAQTKKGRGAGLKVYCVYNLKTHEVYFRTRTERQAFKAIDYLTPKHPELMTVCTVIIHTPPGDGPIYGYTWEFVDAAKIPQDIVNRFSEYYQSSM